MAEQSFVVKTGFSGSGANLTSIPNSALSNSTITINGTPVSLGGSISNLATTTDVSTAISNLVNSAPSTLDTLNELATALGNDANFSTTITNSLAAKAPLSSPTFTTIGGDEGGQINFGLPATNTTLNTAVALDIYQNKFRIFEAGGSNRGASLDITTLSNNLGSELLAAAPQSGNSGKFLTTDGTNATWATVSGGSSAWTLKASGTLSSSSVNVGSINAAEILIVLPNFVQSSTSKPEIRFNNNSTSGDYGVQYHENNTGVFVWGSGSSGKGFVYVNGANTTSAMKFGLSNLYPSYVKISEALTSVQIVAGGGGTWSSGSYEVWTR